MKECSTRPGWPTARFGVFDEAEAALALPPPARRALGGEDRRPGRGQGRARHRRPRRGRGRRGGQAVAATAFGDAGRRVVIEEGLAGPECSLLVLCDGTRASPRSRWPRTTSASATTTPAPTPAAWGPTRRYPAACRRRRRAASWTRSWSRPWPRCAGGASTTAASSTPGSCSPPTGPRLLEYNVRFGDPETQVVLPRVDEDLTGLLAEAAAGRLRHRSRARRRTPRSAWCWPRRGYPTDPRTRRPDRGARRAAGRSRASPSSTPAPRRDDQGRLSPPAAGSSRVTGAGADHRPRPASAPTPAWT